MFAGIVIEGTGQLKSYSVIVVAAGVTFAACAGVARPPAITVTLTGQVAVPGFLKKIGTRRLRAARLIGPDSAWPQKRCTSFPPPALKFASPPGVRFSAMSAFLGCGCRSPRSRCSSCCS